VSRFRTVLSVSATAVRSVVSPREAVAGGAETGHSAGIDLLALEVGRSPGRVGVVSPTVRVPLGQQPRGELGA
jgi:hypothetical protein